jgi:hypothetical protein
MQTLAVGLGALGGFEFHIDLEASMLDYETLILKHEARPTAFVEIRNGDDDDAIRFAVRIADGRPFEVWRDIVCIHRVAPALRAASHAA